MEVDVGRGMVMGEAAIARSAASDVSKIATIGRFWFGEVLVVSYLRLRYVITSPNFWSAASSSLLSDRFFGIGSPVM